MGLVKIFIKRIVNVKQTRCISSRCGGGIAQHLTGQAAWFGWLLRWEGGQGIFQDKVGIGPTEGFVQGHGHQVGLGDVEQFAGHVEFERPDHQGVGLFKAGTHESVGFAAAGIMVNHEVGYPLRAVAGGVESGLAFGGVWVGGDGFYESRLLEKEFQFSHIFIRRLKGDVCGIVIIHNAYGIVALCMLIVIFPPGTLGTIECRRHRSFLDKILEPLVQIGKLGRLAGDQFLYQRVCPSL